MPEFNEFLTVKGGNLTVKDSQDRVRFEIQIDPVNFDAYLKLRDLNNRMLLNFDIDNAILELGPRDNPSSPESGHLRIYNSAGKRVIKLAGDEATISLGGEGRELIRIDGNRGDIILQNADCAEEFEISVLEQVEPGTVMVIDQEERLLQSTEAYDKKVAGVVSGAGDLKPGLILDKQSESTNRMPIALMGKVYCKVDAEYAPIEVGDLLTTSPTPGHAMKATDPLKAFGTIIGKALVPLEAGKGVIPILVALQ